MCKGPSFPAKMRKNGTSECELDPSFCSRVETFLWEILELYKGLKESLEIQILGVISVETPQRKRASSRLEGRSSWILLS